MFVAVWSTKVVTGKLCAAEKVGNGKNCSLSEVNSDDPMFKITQQDVIKFSTVKVNVDRWRSVVNMTEQGVISTCRHTFISPFISKQKTGKLQEVGCNRLVINKPISGCVRIAFDSLSTTSLLQVVNEFVAKLVIKT